MYSIEGDVWSFAIVLAEICSLGNNPYVEHRSLTANFITFLSNGGRMERGQGWSAYLYSVMTRCWHTAPSQRPSFAQLVKEFGVEQERLAQGGADARTPRHPVPENEYEMPAADNRSVNEYEMSSAGINANNHAMAAAFYDSASEAPRQLCEPISDDGYEMPSTVKIDTPGAVYNIPLATNVRPGVASVAAYDMGGFQQPCGYQRSDGMQCKNNALGGHTGTGTQTAGGNGAHAQGDEQAYVYCRNHTCQADGCSDAKRSTETHCHAHVHAHAHRHGGGGADVSNNDVHSSSGYDSHVHTASKSRDLRRALYVSYGLCLYLPSISCSKAGQ